MNKILDYALFAVFQLPARYVGSLQEKWSKKVQPLVFINAEMTGTMRTSDSFATSLEKLVTSVGKMMNGWQMQQALSHCSGDALKEYNDLIIRKQIQLLKDSAGNKVSSHLNITTIALTNAYKDGSACGIISIDSNSAHNDVIDKESIDVSLTTSVESEVPGTNPHKTFDD
jgi:hypothetical protein